MKDNSHYFKILFSGIFISFCISSSLQAQEVQGTVSDAQTGDPLPGVNVIIINTTTGTATNVDGFYEIPVTSLNDTLVFSYLGYQSQEIPLEGRSEINLSMEPEALTGEDVVVVGYGTTSRRTLSHSVAQVPSERIQDRPVSRLDQALQGQMAGVHIRQVAGTPGEPLEIRVRGGASISAGNSPLYVVDGIPVEDLGRISINDVESIEVLKDAASTAVYGSRGSNGVVLVTTKRGESGQTNFEVRANYGIQVLENRLDLMSAEEWIDYAIEHINNNWVNLGLQTGQNYQASDPVSFRRQELEVPTADGRNPETGLFYNSATIPDPRWTGEAPNDLVYIDWQDEFYNPAALQQYQVAASGGASNVRYRLSGNYLNQDGIALNSNYEQISLRANFDVDFTEDFRMGVMLAPNVSWNRGGNVDGRDQQALSVMRVPPLAEPEAGIYTGMGPYQRYSWAGSWITPVGFQEHATNEVQNGGYFSRLFLDANLLENVSLRVTGSLNNNNRQAHTYYPTHIQRGNFGQPEGALSSSGFNTQFRNDYLFESLLTFRETLGTSHNFGGIVGYTFEHQRVRGSNQGHSQFPDDLLQVFHHNSSTVNSSTSTALQHSLISYFARVTYDYDERYLATASFRRDGSSRFGPNNRWGNFPAFSLAWRISEESFLEQAGWLNEFKIRYSWGLNGNNAVPNYIYYGNVSRANYAFGGGVAPAYVPSSMSNFDLGWETTISHNIGIDFDLFSNRLSLTADYYRKHTSDLLLNVPVPTATGFASGWENIGEVMNEGLEFELTGRHFSANFNVESSFNIAFNRNEVLALGRGDAPIHTGFQNRTELISVGHPLGSYYMLEAIGVYMTEEDLENNPTMANSIVGDVMYRDVNGDGIIDADDRTFVGQRDPRYTWGFYNNFQYRNFGLSFLLQGAGGNQIMSILGRTIDRTTMGISAQGLGHWRDRWRSEDDPGNGQVPRIDGTTGGEIDSRWIYDATYVRLRNVTLSYNLPASLTTRLGLDFFRVYISGENLLLFDRYYGGYSPEADNDAGGDAGGYPISRVFNLGVEFNF